MSESAGRIPAVQEPFDVRLIEFVDRQEIRGMFNISSVRFVQNKRLLEFEPAMSPISECTMRALNKIR